MNTNLWNHVQTYEEYIDYDKELISFQDEGNSSVDLRLTFDRDEHTAYLTLQKHNDDGNTIDLPPSQINITWDEGLRLLSEDIVTLENQS